MSNSDTKEIINRNAFISDLIELNSKLEKLNEKSSIDGYDYDVEVIRDHFDFSIMFIVEGFSRAEVENLVKIFCPLRHEKVVSIIYENM